MSSSYILDTILWKNQIWLAGENKLQSQKHFSFFLTISFLTFNISESSMKFVLSNPDLLMQKNHLIHMQEYGP